MLALNLDPFLVPVSKKHLRFSFVAATPPPNESFCMLLILCIFMSAASLIGISSLPSLVLSASRYATAISPLVVVFKYVHVHIFEYMNDPLFELHAELCKALADPKRLELLRLLSEGEKTVSELESLMRIRQANLSQHLAVLRQRNVVVTKRRGTTISYKIANRKLIKACNLIREVLIEQLENTGKIAVGATR